MDILEHEAAADRERDEITGGFPMDGHIDDYEFDDNEDEVDPFVNSYLTEDDIVFGDDYKIRDYVSDAVKRRIYYLYCEKGWTIKALTQKFRLRAERVSVIIAMKRTEPEFIETGRYRTDIDELMAQLYGGDESRYLDDHEDDFDQGIHVKILKDDQLPEDVVPEFQVPANALPMRVSLPKLEPPPRDERTYKSKFAFADISESAKKRSPVRVVDWDGTAREASQTEVLYRTWTSRSYIPRRDPSHDPEAELRATLRAQRIAREEAAAAQAAADADAAAAAAAAAAAEAEAAAAAAEAEAEADAAAGDDAGDGDDADDADAEAEAEADK